MQKDQAVLVKKNFIKILETDIKKLRKIIEEKYFETYNDLNAADRVSSIDFTLFKDLVNEICFDNLSHTEKRPISQVSDKNPDFYERIVYDIPEDRLNMFNELFEVPESKVTIPSDISTLTISLINPKELYYLFFFYIFHHLPSSQNDLEHILDKMLTEWKTAVRTRKFPISFNIHLDRILIEKDFKNQPFQLTNIFNKEITRLSPYRANIYMPQFLVFEAEIPLFIYETNKNTRIEDDHEMFIQLQNKFNEFKDFMCALYVHNYYLPNPRPIIKLPWWIETEWEYLKKFTKKADDEFIYKEFRRLTETDFKSVLKTYSLLKEKGFYDRSCFPLLFSVKNVAFSEQFKLERIFYSHTLLEFLFSPHPPIDLSFKIPINASLQISENFDQFYQNFVLLRGMYNIRSKALHGEDWVEVINKTINKLNTVGFQIRNITDLFKKFDEVILKILNCLVKFPRVKSSIIESLDDSNLLSFRKKKYEYLIELGEFYDRVRNYILSLKVFYEASYIAQLLTDENKILESGEKIKQIFNINENVLAYPNEFDLVQKELTMISDYNAKKQTIAKEAQEKILTLRTKTIPDLNGNKIKLEINGNIIMKELNLEEGPIVGKILSLIERKIRLGELENEENILRSYLKTVDLSLLM